MYNDLFLEKRLAERATQDAVRSLITTNALIDFCSNDYLGIATKGLLKKAGDGLSTGSGGSRSLAGNYPLIEEVENSIAKFHEAESGLLFNSGYDANLGLISSIAGRTDTIYYDQLSHASLRDGIVLSKAQAFSFQHNDLTDLEKKLQHRTGNCFIVTESLFSMDGDFCDIENLVALSDRYNAHLVIDEAHATGIVGNKGEGLVQQLGFEDKVFARVHTFGKAVGCHGAIVLGSKRLKSYLLNFSRSFMYTTSLPPQSVAAIKAAYALFPEMDKERMHLNKLINIFRDSSFPYTKIESQSAIQGVIIPGNEAVKAKAKQLQDAGIDVRAILYPTVPKGAERLRIILHAFNTEAELIRLIELLQ
jgi:8-amino-7-oxononanoate synthase